MMKEYPLVSVITSSYNSIGTLSQCISSVSSQTYPNIEHIVIDAGSDDGSSYFLQQHYAEQIVIYSIPFCGVSEARNYGVFRAHGKYIAILDADDFFLPDKIRLQVEFLESQKDYVAVGTNFFTERNDCDNSRKKYYHYPSSHSDLKLLLTCGINPIAHSSLMYSRESFLDAKGYSEYLKKAEDFGFILKLLSIGKIHNISECLIGITLHKDSHSNSYEPDKLFFYQMLAILDSRYFRDEKLCDKYMTLIKNENFEVVDKLFHKNLIRDLYLAFWKKKSFLALRYLISLTFSKRKIFMRALLDRNVEFSLNCFLRKNSNI